VYYTAPGQYRQNLAALFEGVCRAPQLEIAFLTTSSAETRHLRNAGMQVPDCTDGGINAD